MFFYFHSELKTRSLDEQKVILSKFRIPLLIGLVLVLASGAVLYIQQQKKSELDAAIELVKISNLRIGVGSYGNQEGTGLFGNLHNEGDEIISIATLQVAFLDDSGETLKFHEFSPVNRFSWMDPKPLKPGESKEFGLLLDEIVPENWAGGYEVKVSKLVFKQ